MCLSNLSDIVNLATNRSSDLGLSSPAIPNQHKWYIFRGQSMPYDSLVPSVFRPPYNEEGVEANFYHAFLLECHESIGYRDSVFERLCFMQHHGLPTRLLDWTRNILVAAFFATDSSGEFENESGEILSFNPFFLNQTAGAQGHLMLPTSGPVILRSVLAEGFLKQEKSAFQRKCENAGYWFDDSLPFEDLFRFLADGDDVSLRETICPPIAVIPPILDNRLHVQQSVFTISGGLVLGNNYPVRPMDLLNWYVDEDGERRQVIKKFSIPAVAKKRIRTELDQIGINHATLFPGVDSVAKQLRSYFG